MKRKILIASTLSILIASSIIIGSSLYISNINRNNNKLFTSNKVYNNSSKFNKFSTNNNLVIVNNFKYILDPTTLTATIMGYENVPSNLSPLVIDDYVQYEGLDYNITSIGIAAFFNSSITTLTLPSTLTSIDRLAFANNFISALSIPANVTKIGRNAFSNNMFHYGTVITLPENCTWNKHYGYSPFDTNNNYSKFTPVVQFIIQGSAVYEYNDNQHGWIVSSYMSKTIANQIYASNNSIYNYGNSSSNNYSNYQVGNFTSPIAITNNDSNPTGYNLNQENNINNPSEQIVLATKLSNTILYFNGQANKGISSYLSFDESTMQFVFHAVDSNATLYSNGSNGEFYFSIYNCNKQNYTISPQWINSQITVNDFAKLFNNLNFNYGDIISFNVPSSWLNPRGFYNTNFFNIGTNYNSNWTNGELNSYINSLYLSDDAWSGYTNHTFSFRITPIGLIPYVNTTKNNPLQVISPNATSFTVTGYSTPNTTIKGIFTNITKTTTTNSDGKYSLIFDNVSNLNLNEYVTIESSTSTSYFTYLKGANPLGVYIGITLNNNSTSFGITFNGTINGMDTYYQASSRFFAQYNSPYDRYTNSSLNGSTSLSSSDSSITLIITRDIDNKTTTNKYTFEFNSTSTINTFQQFLNKIPLTGITNITFQTTNAQIKMIYSNDMQISYGYNLINSTYTYSFTYSLSKGLINTINPEESNSYTGDNQTNFSQTINTTWGNSPNNYLIKYWLTNYALYGGGFSGYYGFLYLGGQAIGQAASNFYDPTSLMYSIVHKLTNGLTNPFAKAWAIESWVHSNFKYGWSKQDYYNMTISQEFNFLTGICGNYSNMSAVLLSLAGFMTRIVTGGVSSPNLFNTRWQIDHAWTQVWFPTYGEWITLDPTFGWFNDPGNMQAKFSLIRQSANISVYLFPPYNANNSQTTISSYFINYPWQELYEMGQFFYMPAGFDATFDNPNVAGSLGILINNQVKEMSEVNSGNYSGYQIEPNTWNNWSNALNSNT